MLRDKKIIFVLGWLGMGGAERQALHVIKHMAHEQGARVEVWAFHTRGDMADMLDEAKISWRLVDWPWPANRVLRLRELARFCRQLRAAKPDIILPYTMQASLFCGLVWKGTGARTCFWNQRDEGRDVFGSLMERRAIHSVSGVLSNSQHAADMLIQKFGLNTQNVRVIRNGVQPLPPEATREQWRNRLGLEDDHFAACMVANIQTFKDHATLLRAWKIVVDRSAENAQKPMLLLAGMLTETSQAMQELAMELELGPHLRFLGGVRDVSGLLHAVDLGVFSSRSEGVPNGVLECMAAGLAVAATDIPGIREALGTEGERFLAPVGDVENLAERILELWNDADLRREMGQRNQSRIEHDFTIERLCRETVQVLELALQKRKVNDMAANDASSGN